MTDEAMADNAADTPPTFTQKVLVEFLGTLILVLLGCGVAVTSGGNLVATGLAFGLTVAFLIYAFGRVSGGHFNPAVAVGAALGGRISWRDAGIYCGAQVGGAIIGALLLMIFALGFDGFEAFDSGTPLGTNGFSEGSYDYAWWAAFLVELVMTLLFVFVILAVTDQRNRAIAVLAPLAIGITLAIIHFMLIPMTGTSVNPARSIGPALFSGGDWLVQLWPFIPAPLIGGALAGLLYPLAMGRDADPVPGSGLSFGAGGSSDPGFTQQWNQNQGGFGQQQDQPIIQDGWQWDPATQQWIPAQQQAPAPGPMQGQFPGSGQVPGQHAQPGQTGQAQGGWAPPAGDQTQVRPPQ